ncbi:MAG: transposase, partial [Anaerolineae bacterium]
MDLTDEQWAVVEALLPKPKKRADGKGRPRVDNRSILNGILWVMRTGAPWH